MLKGNNIKLVFVVVSSLLILLSFNSYSQTNNSRNEITISELAKKISDFAVENYRNQSDIKSSTKLKDIFSISSLVDQMLLENWSGSSWEPFLKYIYTYNQYYNISQMLGQMYNEGWADNMLYLYTYDNNQFLTQELYQMWFDNSWVDLMRESYTNNTLGNPIQILTESKSILGGEWQYNTFDTRSYDFADRVSNSIVQEWNGEGWENSYQVHYTYNLDGDLQHEIEQVWDGSNWINNWQTTFTYSEQGMISELISQVWEENHWVNDLKETFEFFGRSSGVIINIYEWNGADWEITDKMTTTYDGFGNDGVTIWEIYEEGSWEYFMRWTYTWSFTDVEENEIIPTKYSLANYPNPFNPSTTIEFGLPDKLEISLSIYDIAGNLVANLIDKQIYTPGNYSKQWNGKNINGNQVSSGVYFYVLRAGENYLTNKMILLR